MHDSDVMLFTARGQVTQPFLDCGRCMLIMHVKKGCAVY